MPSQYVEMRWNNYHSRMSGAPADYHVPKQLAGVVVDVTSSDVVPRAECTCRGCVPTDNQ